MTRFVMHILALIVFLPTSVMTRKLTLLPPAFMYHGCSHLAGLLLCVLTFNALVVQLDANHQTCNRGKIEPQSAYFWLDEEFQITCTAGPDFIGNLTFHVLDKPNFKTWNEVYVGNNSIQLTGELHTESQRHKFMFKCIEETSDGSEICHDNVYVDFEYRPVKPDHLQLRIYDWDTMMLTWDLVQPYLNQHHINVTCQFQAYVSAGVSGNGARNFVNCPLVNNTACYWNESLYTDADLYYIRISVVNINNNVTATTEEVFKRDQHVEPAQLTWLTTKETRSGCLYLKWKAPLRSGLDFLYNISYFSDCGDSKVNYSLVEYKSRMGRRRRTTICSLTANANYTFTVTAIVSIDNKSVGYWSKPVPRPFKMAKQVPAMSPVWTEGLYEYVNDGIKLYLEPLSRCDLHANSGQYILSNGSEVIATAPATDSFMFVPLTHINQLLYLYTKNDQGVSDKSTNVTLSQNLKGLKPSRLLAEYIHSKTNSCRQIYFSTHGNPNNEQDLINLTHTLVYCVGVTICKSEVYWRQINSNDTMEDCDGYRFGLITKGYSRKDMDVVATEITWNECVYDREKVPEAMPQESFRVDKEQPPGTLKIGWEPLSCQAGYVSHYVLEYCPVEKQCDCSGDVNTKIIPGEEQGVTLSELDASRVCVRIWGANSAGEGLKVELGPFEITPNEFAIVLLITLVSVFVLCGLILFYRFVWPRCKQYREKLPISDFLAETHVLQDMSPVPPVPEPAGLEGIHIDSSTETSRLLPDSGHSSLSTDGSHEEVRNQTTDADSAIGSQSIRPAYLYTETSTTHDNFTDDIDMHRISEAERLDTEASYRRVSTGDNVSQTDPLDGYEDADDISVGDDQECYFPDSHSDLYAIHDAETFEQVSIPDVTAESSSCRPDVKEHQHNVTDTVITANNTMKQSQHKHKDFETEGNSFDTPNPEYIEEQIDRNASIEFHKDHCDTNISVPFDQMLSVEGSSLMPEPIEVSEDTSDEYLSNYDRPTDIDISNENIEADNESQSVDMTVTPPTVKSGIDQDASVPSEDIDIDETPQNGTISIDDASPELTESDEDGQHSDYPDYIITGSAIHPSHDGKDTPVSVLSLDCLEFCKSGLNETDVDVVSASSFINTQLFHYTPKNEV